MAISAIPVIDDFVAGQVQAITGTSCAGATIQFWGFDRQIAATYGNVYGDGGAADFQINTVTADSSGVWSVVANTFESYGYFAFAICPGQTISAKSLLYNVTPLPISAVPTINNNIKVDSNEITGTIGAATSSQLVQVYMSNTPEGFANQLATAVVTGTNWKATRGLEFVTGTILPEGAVIKVRQRESTAKDFSPFSESVTVGVGNTLPKVAISSNNTRIGSGIIITNKVIGFYTGFLVKKAQGAGAYITVNPGEDYNIEEDVVVFLTIGIFTITGTRANFANSVPSDAITVTTNITETPSVFKVGDNSIKLTMSNGSNNKVITPFLNDAPILPVQTSANEYTFTGLENGTYKFRVKIAALAQSEDSLSIVIDVPVVVLPPLRKFQANVIYCDVPENDVQIGTGNSPTTVNNWTDGNTLFLRLQIGVTPPTFYVRQKSVPSRIFVISPNYTVTLL